MSFSVSSSRRIKRLLIGLILFLVVIFSLLLGAGYLYLSWTFEKAEQRSVTPVLAIPPDPDRVPNRPAYDGPHPRVLARPPDPYPYPIPIGKVGPHVPVYAGPLQYPFYCRTEDSGLGQPLVDNQQGIGVPVYEEGSDGKRTTRVLGYSKDCLIPTQVQYLYNREGGERFFPLEEAADDIAKIEIDGQVIDFIVRVETGSINRFPYVIAALRGPEGSVEQPDGQYWNGRLIYQFRGGVGIGKVQGRISTAGLLKRRIKQLRLGYAIAYSSANQTSNHYNILLAEETVARVKRQFRARYGQEVYTVGIGGSGGALQQYLIAQNNPGILDAAIPLYSYPDMITQIQYAFDCELLEYYFDVIASDNPRWRDWHARSLIEGTSASTEQISPRAVLYDLAMLLRARKPHLFSGSNECVSAWRGLTQLVNNPRYLFHAVRYARSVLDSAHWSYWDDMKHLLGTDARGYAQQTWDNVGVQYGLAALRNGDISIKEFLHLNANVGSWKRPDQMRPERYWKLGGIGAKDTLESLFSFSPWGHHNMELSPDEGKTPARRQEGDADAMTAAYRAGLVFLGVADIPIIDLRHYLDDKLDMHHSFSSLSARARLEAGQGHYGNQLIWVSRRPHDPVPDAFAAIDYWMENVKEAPEKSVAQNRPQELQDRCYDARGEVIAEGDSVWDGRWNQRETGLCAQRYPPFMESRMVAGAPFSGEVLKCRLQSVEQAIKSGVYGAQLMWPYLAELNRIFPSGVCDYRLGDAARPEGLLIPPGNPRVLDLQR